MIDYWDISLLLPALCGSSFPLSRLTNHSLTLCSRSDQSIGCHYQGSLRIKESGQALPVPMRREKSYKSCESFTNSIMQLYYREQWCCTFVFCKQDHPHRHHLGLSGVEMHLEFPELGFKIIFKF